MLTTQFFAVEESKEKNHESVKPNENELQKCRFLLNQALDADEAGCKDIAIKLYTDAVAFGLSVVSKTENETVISLIPIFNLN